MFIFPIIINSGRPSNRSGGANKKKRRKSYGGIFFIWIIRKIVSLNKKTNDYDPWETGFTSEQFIIINTILDLIKEHYSGEKDV